MKSMHNKSFFYVIVAAVGLFVFVYDRCCGTNLPSWPTQVSQIKYISSADSTFQPALFYRPQMKKAVPLLVALHTWSGDYTQKMSIPYAQWCIENN